MNGVDHMDQLRSTLVTQRREKRVHMTMLTYIMDLSVTQSFAIYQKINEGNAGERMSFLNFKYNICEPLFTPLQKSRPVGHPAGSRKTKTASTQNTVSTPLTINETVGIIDSPHLVCKKGFQVNCFVAHHFQGGLSNSHKTLVEVAFKAEKHPKITCGTSYCPKSLADMKLPQDKGTKLANVRKRKKST